MLHLLCPGPYTPSTTWIFWSEQQTASSFGVQGRLRNLQCGSSGSQKRVQGGVLNSAPDVFLLVFADFAGRLLLAQQAACRQTPTTSTSLTECASPNPMHTRDIDPENNQNPQKTLNPQTLTSNHMPRLDCPSVSAERALFMPGLSESELERFNVAFFRFKDPDGPEMHKAWFKVEVVRSLAAGNLARRAPIKPVQKKVVRSSELWAVAGFKNFRAAGCTHSTMTTHPTS